MCGACTAQSQGDSSAQTVPVGQTFVHFEFPVYQEGKLRYILTATEAKGITLNRAETSNLKIDIYDNGAVSTTITSPKADLLVSEQKMRTKNTVQIVRADMEASSQDCDFDVKAKKFLLRNNVKVLLKHFDLNEKGSEGSAGKMPSAAPQPAGVTPAPVPAQAPAEAEAAPAPAMPSAPSVPSGPSTSDPAPTARGTDSLLASPGAYSDTNSAPIPPAK